MSSLSSKSTLYYPDFDPYSLYLTARTRPTRYRRKSRVRSAPSRISMSSRVKVNTKLLNALMKSLSVNEIKLRPKSKSIQKKRYIPRRSASGVTRNFTQKKYSRGKFTLNKKEIHALRDELYNIKSRDHLLGDNLTISSIEDAIEKLGLPDYYRNAVQYNRILHETNQNLYMPRKHARRLEVMKNNGNLTAYHRIEGFMNIAKRKITKVKK